MTEINDGHYLEATDRAHTIQVMLDELLEKHPLIEGHEGARNCYRVASSAVADLYQYLGRLMHERDEKTKPTIGVPEVEAVGGLLPITAHDIHLDIAAWSRDRLRKREIGSYCEVRDVPTATDLYNSFSAWFQAKYDLSPPILPQFSKALSEMGYRRQSFAGRWRYIDVEFINKEGR